MDKNINLNSPFCVLISCMYQDKDIINRSNVRANVVVINQCDEESKEAFVFTDATGKNHQALFINTKERGLSRSRNMAVNNSLGDICLLCDDDELLENDVERIITDSYTMHPECGVISFALKWNGQDVSYPGVKAKMGLMRIQRTSSLQISFRRSRLIEKGICFDEKMGSGTGNGGGEENKLLNDCRCKGIEMIYVPQVIATILPGESKWFSTRDEKWFENLGWTNTRIHGYCWGLVYIWYWLTTHFRLKREVGIFNALKSYYKGMFSKR